MWWNWWKWTRMASGSMWGEDDEDVFDILISRAVCWPTVSMFWIIKGQNSDKEPTIGLLWHIWDFFGTIFRLNNMLDSVCSIFLMTLRFETLATEPVPFPKLTVVNPTFIFSSGWSIKMKLKLEWAICYTLRPLFFNCHNIKLPGRDRATPTSNLFPTSNFTSSYVSYI